MSAEIIVPLVILLPLIGAFINGVFYKNMPKIVVGTIATSSVAFSFILTLIVFLQLNEAININLFSIISLPNISLNASLLVDNLSIWMTLIVTGVGSLIHLFSMGYMKEDVGYAKFFTYLNLFIFAMLLLVLGSNYFMLFFGWEGVGICSYLLIGFHYADKHKGLLNSIAARKAFIMNRIGDLGLLIGLFLLLMQFGTLEYSELANIVSATDFINPKWIMFCITLCLFIGATGKSAQIPLFTWLPDAMAGPTPVSALIHAATMVTAGIFLTVRSNFLFENAELTKNIMLNIGLITSIVAAFIALRQNDIKKVLAYSTVSQLGLLFVALGLGAYTAAMFHVTTHAFFKALLFLGAGSVIHAMSDEQNISKMGELKKFIPITHWTFLIGTLAITGFPLLSGFYSKDEILGYAFTKSVPLYLILMFSVILTAIYMFRLYFLVFHGKFRGTDKQKNHLHESPKTMTIPLIFLAVLSIFGGILNLPGLFLNNGTHYMSNLFKQNVVGMNLIHDEHLSSVSVFALMITAICCCLAVLYLSYIIYVKKNSLPKKSKQLSTWERISENKLYFDEIYNFLFVRPIEWLSQIGYRFFEIIFLNGIVFGLAKGFETTGNLIRRWQNGQINWYVFWMVSGIICFIIYFLVKI
jgi:NADH-quinone oxidoreductase subunit L